MALDVAAQRWPALVIDAGAFDQYLLRLTVDEAAIATHGADLAIAFACASGSAVAIREIEDELRRQSATARKRFDLDDDALSEVTQIVRTKLLSGSPPRVATYVASGPLGAWIRMVVIRAAIDYLSRRGRLHGESLPLEEIASDMMGLDVAVDGAKQLPRLKESLEAVLSALGSEDRLLLKLHYLDGVTLERLSVLLQVHRATVARRIATLRRNIIKEVGGRMGARFGMHPSEFQSLWRTLGTHIQVTISRLLTS